VIVIGRHTLDETVSEMGTIDQNIREILDIQTEEFASAASTTPPDR